MTTDPGDLVLDPTCGSGTTAYVAEQWGRRWITIDTSRVALALARSRLMAAKYPYYLLADSEAGIRKEAEVTGQAPLAVDRDADQRRPARLRLRARAARDPQVDRPEPGHPRGHDARGDRRRDRPPRRHRDPVRPPVRGPQDRPRVGPVHRREPVAPPRPRRRPRGPAGRRADAVASTPAASSTASSTTSAAPASRTPSAPSASSSLRLDPYPGVYVQGVGEYPEGGQAKTVAIAIGPEFGTVGPELVRDAAKEAVQIADLLVVCGFAFDPLAGEEAASLGRLTILQARMNPDLAMGDELLKKTGTGNLFMVFGEPDIDVRPVGDGQLQVEIRGLDVYDPTTGEVRSSSVDDIAAWFLDTDYDGEAFFVRHAYFTGADDPYDKLRRALRADISDEAWATVNSTVSRPFPRPSTGKIAVKVINHYGDEVVEVIPLAT